MLYPNDPQYFQFIRALAAGDELAWAVWRETYLENYQMALERAKGPIVASMQAVDNPGLLNRF